MKSRGVAGAVLVAGLLIPASAQAAPATGEVTIAIGKGKAAKSLKAADIEVSGVGGARGDGNVSLAVTDLSAGPALALSGGLRFKGPDGALVVDSLQLTGAGSSTAISGRAGKRGMTIFTGGAATPTSQGLTVGNSVLRLTNKAAKAIRKALDVERKLRGGKAGRLTATAALSAPAPAPTAPQQPTPPPPPPGLVDPYADVCDLDVVSRTEGSVPDPAGPPTLNSPVDLESGSIAWNVRSSLSSYVLSFGGSLTPIAPATMNPTSPTPGTPPTFSFPTAGQYSIGDAADDSDDKAVINGTGEAVFCHKSHDFRVTLSDPTITIDGADSRLTVDVDTNHSGVHTPTQRVDLATLGTSAVDPFYNGSGSKVTWNDLPVTLTQAGSDALALCNSNNPGFCDYEAGDTLDPITVAIDTGDGTEVAWPFTATCNPAAPGSAVSPFPATPDGPAALPTLVSPVTASAGTVNWGIRRALRSSVTSGGTFAYSGGASRTSLGLPGTRGDYFTWVGGDGQWQRPAAAGQTGRLVMRAEGSVGLCQVNQGNYSLIVSEPEVVIDGANSRMSAHVSVRNQASWTSGRVDLVSLDQGDEDVTTVTSAGPAAGQETVTWTFPDPGTNDVVEPYATGCANPAEDDCNSANSDVLLTAAGAQALSLLGIGAPSNPYATDAPLDPVRVTAVVPEAGP